MPRFFCGFDSLKILPKDNKTRENTGRGGRSRGKGGVKGKEA